MRHQTQIVRIATSLLLAVVVLGQGGTHVARADTRWTNLVIFAEVSERVPRQGGEWGRVLRVFITNEGTRDTVPTTTRVVIRMEDARRQWSAVSTYNIQTGALRPGQFVDYYFDLMDATSGRCEIWADVENAERESNEQDNYAVRVWPWPPPVLVQPINPIPFR
jgi:hypothetical protein